MLTLWNSSFFEFHRNGNPHLKQGTISQLSEAFDGFLDKLIIFKPIMWLGQIHGHFYCESMFANCSKGLTESKQLMCSLFKFVHNFVP